MILLQQAWFYKTLNTNWAKKSICMAYIMVSLERNYDTILDNESFNQTDCQCTCSGSRCNMSEISEPVAVFPQPPVRKKNYLERCPVDYENHLDSDLYVHQIVSKSTVLPLSPLRTAVQCLESYQLVLTEQVLKLHFQMSERYPLPQELWKNVRLCVTATATKRLDLYFNKIRRGSFFAQKS